MSAKISTRKHFLLAATAVALVLTGCDEINGMKNEKVIHSVAEDNEPRIDESAGKSSKNLTSSDPLTISEGIWVGNQAVRMRRGQPLPTKFDNDNGFALVSTNALTLADIATQIANNTNIPVRMGDMTLPTSTGAATAAPAVDAGPQTMSLSYEGPLTTFLDQVASQFNVSWRYDGHGIYLYRYESKTFTVESMPGKSSLNDGFDTSTSSSGSSGGSSGSSGSNAGQDIKQKNDMTAELDYWKDLEAAIKGILGSEGTVTLMQTSGTVTVTAQPSKLAQVSHFLDAENNRLGRQIAIDLVIYSVTLDDTNNYGLNLSGALKGSKLFGSHDKGTITLTGPSIPSASSLTTATAGSLSIAMLGSHWSPTLVPQALSAIGNVSEVTRSPVVTLNNRPASREVTIDQAYLASTTSTPATVAGQAATVTLTPGVATTGIALQMLPRILDDGRILLQYSIKLTDLIKITSASNGTGDTAQSIQTPETSNKIFVQQAVMQNGSTLVLAGFDKNSNTDDKNGVGSASNWLLGGGTTNNKNREQIVITITPHEITPERGSAQGS